MSQLRELATITIPSGTLYGYLYIGADGLPEVEVPPIEGHMGIHAGPLRFCPATFPAAWSIWSPHGVAPGPLLEAWWKIEGIQDQLAKVQREEAEGVDD